MSSYKGSLIFSLWLKYHASKEQISSNAKNPQWENDDSLALGMTNTGQNVILISNLHQFCL